MLVKCCCISFFRKVHYLLVFSQGALFIFKTYSATSGLQDPVLGQTLSFDIHRTEPFVQVLHDGYLH